MKMNKKMVDSIIKGYNYHLSQPVTKFNKQGFSNSPSHVREALEIYASDILISIKQFVVMNKLLASNNMNNKNSFMSKSLMNNKETVGKFRQFTRSINKKILAKFKTPKEFAYSVAMRNVASMMIAFAGDAEGFKHEIAILKKNAKSRDAALKELETKLKNSGYVKLTESDALLELDIKKITSTVLGKIKTAFVKTMGVLFEGWSFALKSLGVVASRIKSKIKKITEIANKKFGRGAYALLAKISPDSIEMLETTMGGKEEVQNYFDNLLGVFAKASGYMITFFTGGAALGAIVGAVSVINKSLDYASSAGDVAAISEVAVSFMNISNDPELAKMLEDL